MPSEFSDGINYYLGSHFPEAISRSMVSENARRIKSLSDSWVDSTNYGGLYNELVKYHGANCFSLSSLAEQGNAHDKTKILLIVFTYFTRFLPSMRKK
jgi:hypothetical protein